MRRIRGMHRSSSSDDGKRSDVSMSCKPLQAGRLLLTVTEMNTRIIPAPNGADRMIGADQCIEAGAAVQANPNNEMGIKTPPIIANDNLASGANHPPFALSFLAYPGVSPRMMYTRERMKPTSTPRKARPDLPGDQWRIWVKTMGKAPKHMSTGEGRRAQYGRWV